MRPRTGRAPRGTPTRQYLWAVVGAVGAVALVACVDNGNVQPPGSSTEATSVTLTSIPFCDPIDRSGPRYQDVSSELGNRITEAIWEIEERYASSPTFAVVGWRTVANAVAELVVVFTDDDPDRDAEIEALVADIVGADRPDFVGVRFEQTRFNAAEMEAADDLLWSRFEMHPEVPLTGAGLPYVLANGEIQDRHRIHLSDLTDADELAVRLDIPPPYDIYCIEPEEKPPDVPAG
jgi:hypothetical protein